MGNDVALDEDGAQEIMNALPAIYVEVDNDYNFTRLYLTSELETGGEMVVDLSFSYPTSVSVTEPVEYRNFSDVIEEVTSSLFKTYGEDTNEPVPTE